MPTMTAGQRRVVAGKIMELISAERFDTGTISKADFLTLIGTTDTQLDLAETAVVTGTPPGVMRTWLVNNPAKARTVLQLVEEGRKVVL